MSEISKEILRNYVKEQKFKNVNEVLEALKGMFKDVLQEALEAEMDKKLGYGKYDISEKTAVNNSRNGYSSKTIKTQLGPVKLNIPRDRNSEFDPKIVPKFQRTVNGIEDID